MTELGHQGGRLCLADEIAEGTARGFDLDGQGRDQLFLVRVNGELRAWRNACPHIAGAPMAWRRHGYLNADGSLIICHAHGAAFLPDSGECVDGPCRGRFLDPVPITVTTDGIVILLNQE